MFQTQRVSTAHRILPAASLLASLLIALCVSSARADFSTCTAPPPPAPAVAAFSGNPPNEGYQVMYQSMWKFIGDNYFDPTRLKNWQALEHAYDDKLGTMADIELAFKSLAEATGDKWTTFITQQDMREHATLEQQGFVTGGLMLYHRGEHYKLDVIQYGSAAYNTALRERDTIECLNNVALDSLSRAQVETLLRGTPGENLKVQAVSAADGSEYAVDLSLAPIPAPQVEGKLLPGNIAYMRMPSFAGEGLITSFVDKYVELSSQAGGNVAGLVLDLRNNLGGELPAAIKFSSLFLDESKVVTQSVLRDKPIKAVYAEKADEIAVKGKPPLDGDLVRQLRKVPLVILINGSSASAAEVTIGALHDNKRGTVIGVTSFGKGVGYKTQRGPVGGLMSVTAFKYLTPLGHEVHELGIDPDVTVTVPRAETRDIQLEAAVAKLKEQLGTK